MRTKVFHSQISFKLYRDRPTYPFDPLPSGEDLWILAAWVTVRQGVQVAAVAQGISVGGGSRDTTALRPGHVTQRWVSSKGGHPARWCQEST